MEVWVRFNLIERPYFDEEGNIVDISGRKNEKGVDAFSGGGKVYPDLSKFKILIWHERASTLVVCLDITEPSEALKPFSKGEPLSYQASSKVRRSYTQKDFCATVLSLDAIAAVKDEIAAGIDERKRPKYGVGAVVHGLRMGGICRFQWVPQHPVTDRDGLQPDGRYNRCGRSGGDTGRTWNL